VQLGEPDTPPGGTAMVNASVDPDSVPDTVPVKDTDPSGVFALAVPLTVLFVWVSCQVTGPGPVESDPVPVYAPLMLAGAAGVEGAEGLPPPQLTETPSAKARYARDARGSVVCGAGRHCARPLQPAPKMHRGKTRVR
jgi:hypothetical protein